MEAEKPEEQGPKRSRISLGALAELENALRDYKEAVRETECARDGIEEQTARSYIRGPEKFVAWLKYEFAPGPPLKGPIPPRSIERPPVGRSRISLSALKEAEVALCEYIREVLDAKLSEWKTNELVDKADYFMSWLKYEFTPGSHKG
jgi:hypothetical protein